MSHSVFGVYYDPSEKKILVVRDKIDPENTKDRGAKLLKCPGGTGFFGETPKATLQREYAEETDLIAVPVGDTLLEEEKQDFNDRSKIHTVFFFEAGLFNTGKKQELIKGDEIDELIWVSLNDIIYEIQECFGSDDDDLVTKLNKQNKYSKRKWLPKEKIPKNTFYVSHLKAIKRFLEIQNERSQY
ncbi:MAG: NUDIX hydrolase [Parcubacteria group bacterium]|nr:NUDIX hydrolase [Parcubacteria group bacterium]